MNNFTYSYYENDNGLFDFSLEFIVGRGDKAQKGCVYIRRNIGHDDFLFYVSLFDRVNLFLNRLIREMNESADAALKGDSIMTRKNRNSMVTSSILSEFFIYLDQAEEVLGKEEKGALLFLINDELFNLKSISHEKAASYLYGAYSFDMNSIEHALENLARKSYSINELLECFLIENYDLKLMEVLYPYLKGSNRYATKEYRSFIDDGIVLGFDSYDRKSLTQKEKDMRRIINTAYAIGASIISIISKQSNLSIQKVKEVLIEQGDVYHTKKGFSHFASHFTKAQLKIFRAFNISTRKTIPTVLEEYIEHTLMHMSEDLKK